MSKKKFWSGYPDPDDPDNFWIDDETGERVDAYTGERSGPLLWTFVKSLRELPFEKQWQAMLVKVKEDHKVLLHPAVKQWCKDNAKNIGQIYVVGK